MVLSHLSNCFFTNWNISKYFKGSNNPITILMYRRFWWNQTIPILHLPSPHLILDLDCNSWFIQTLAFKYDWSDEFYITYQNINCCQILLTFEMPPGDGQHIHSWLAWQHSISGHTIYYLYNFVCKLDIDEDLGSSCIMSVSSKYGEILTILRAAGAAVYWLVRYIFKQQSISIKL